MGELGALVTAWQDRRAAFGPRPTASWIGEKVGVKSRSSVGPWLRGESMPSAEHLRALAELIGVSYRAVLDAALFDAGYLEEREYRGDTAPKPAAGSAPAGQRVIERRARTARLEPHTGATPPPGSGHGHPAQP